MKRNPIYVELDIQSDMDKLWTLTQKPELHQQWDLRFSEIHYVPEADSDIQRFLYKTRIGFGLEVTGSGATKTAVHPKTGKRISVLRFGSDQRSSLIREGSGYWKYQDKGSGGIRFSTQYDYKTRFGLAGAWFDRLLFRPLFGLATAWSFDVLRLWAEKDIPPLATIRKAFIHALSVMMLVVLWCYEGLVPKLLFPEAGELDLLRQSGLAGEQEGLVLTLLGIAEIGVGLLTLLFHKSRLWYRLLMSLLAILMLGAWITDPQLMKAPFNPLTLSGSMMGFCLMASLSAVDLPSAYRPARKPVPGDKSRKGGVSRDLDL
ncbi:DoxX-like family protein [Paenibacillus sp. JZ16]|uniref:DoxX-like family protein n=1 Tax=Paenibacillus sp. JZ16 TaxID=1906272 RepID=UPI00188BF44C|nr:DoxX-like family protein [Paenibacillus sp. JZ16]